MNSYYPEKRLHIPIPATIMITKNLSFMKIPQVATECDLKWGKGIE